MLDKDMITMKKKNKEYDNMEEGFFIECVSLCLQ